MTKADALKEIERLNAIIAELKETVDETRVNKAETVEKKWYHRRVTNEERIDAEYKAAVEADGKDRTSMWLGR